MKKHIAWILALTLVLSCAAAQAAEVKLSIAHIASDDSTWHRAALFFKEQVEERSGGRIEANIYPDGLLGDEIDQVASALMGGGVDIVIVGAAMQSYAPELAILSIPYLMTSAEHAEAVASGPVGDEIEAILFNEGLRCLAHFLTDPHAITADREIHSPADMQGLILRTGSSADATDAITAAVFDALGATSVSLSPADVLGYLQSGDLQAQESSLAEIRSQGYAAAQSHLIRTGHLRSWVYFAIAEHKFRSMPEDLQQIVTEAASEMQEYEHALFLADEQSLLEELQAAGMTVVEVDQASFIELADGAMESLMEGEYRYLKPVYDEIKVTEPQAN